MHTDLPEHVAGLLMMTTGAIQPNRPSMGAWLGYGLGTENQNLPAFISICHKGRHRPGDPAWNSSFLAGHLFGNLRRHREAWLDPGDKIRSSPTWATPTFPVPISNGRSTCWPA